jgi:hypothetical protein
MVIKGQPKEFENKPLISEEDTHKGNSERYVGRVIIEFWHEAKDNAGGFSFAWSVDDPDRTSEVWKEHFLEELKRAMRHIEDSYGARL